MDFPMKNGGPFHSYVSHYQRVCRNFDTIWLFNIAMKNGPFIDGFAIKTTIYRGFSMAMLNNQRVPVQYLDPCPFSKGSLMISPQLADRSSAKMLTS